MVEWTKPTADYASEGVLLAIERDVASLVPPTKSTVCPVGFAWGDKLVQKTPSSVLSLYTPVGSTMLISSAGYLSLISRLHEFRRYSQHWVEQLPGSVSPVEHLHTILGERPEKGTPTYQQASGPYCSLGPPCQMRIARGYVGIGSRRRAATLKVPRE